MDQKFLITLLVLSYVCFAASCSTKGDFEFRDPITGSLMHMSEGLCDCKRPCYHNQSSLCVTAKRFSCSHQLPQDSEGDCLVDKISSECDLDTPSLISPWDNRLFNLGAYWLRTWQGKRSAFNITFPSPAWNELKFRVEIIHRGKGPICRKFTLSNASLPLPSSLFFDCPLYATYDGLSKQRYQFAVLSGDGEGGTYRFTLPEESRINPWQTPLHDWHVFFFYHLDALYRQSQVPITLQTVPYRIFGEVSYNVSLVKCVDGHEDCNERAVLASQQVTPPEDATEVTVFLPVWSNIAVYAFTVQIISENCTKGDAKGCFVAISPVHVVEFSKLGIWSCIIFGVILSFSLVFFITLHRRIKTKRLLLTKLREKPRKVLLVYLPETSESLDMVKTLAAFFRDCCYIHPFMIDTDVGCQDPKTWTYMHFEAAECVLFLVPGNLKADSSTPIRDHWNHAVNYVAGRYSDYSKIAAVTFPFSADVPDKLPYESRFSVPSQMEQLVTWIHGGNWLDRKLLWGPEISSSLPGNKDHWHRIRKAVADAAQASQKLGNHLKALEWKSTSINIPNGKIEDSKDDDEAFEGGSNRSTSVGKESDSSSDEEAQFDPQIPDLVTIFAPQDRSVRSNAPLTSDESSDEEMDARLFVS